MVDRIVVRNRKVVRNGRQERWTGQLSRTVERTVVRDSEQDSDQ